MRGWHYDVATFRADLQAALSVAFLGVPQAIAYAVIAGLPPAMGLYASALPAIFGSLFRSSRHVVAGPTNAVSLLVGTAVAGATQTDAVTTALVLAFMVGVIQAAAGLLRLGALVDFISLPVVVGYITGAGVLIGAGQLANLTGTTGASGGHLLHKIAVWVDGLGGADVVALAFGLGTAAAILALRRVSRKIPTAVVTLGLATLASYVFDLDARGLRTVADLSPVPSGLPPFTVPDIALWAELLPLAVAVTVLSLVESSSLARALAVRSGQRLDVSREFVGQGIANLASAFTGGYPVSGSLARSELNLSSGAATRAAGALSGVFILLVLVLAGSAFDFTPIAALAGLLLVVAMDLVNVRRIRAIFRAGRTDALAFAATALGTFVLSLDLAIYAGVGISLVLYLRRARLLHISRITFGANRRPHEHPIDEKCPDGCDAICILQVDGQLFFAAAGELQRALDVLIADTDNRVAILRLRNSHGIDASVLTVLEDAARRLRDDDRTLMLTGLDSRTRDVVLRSELGTLLGAENVHGTPGEWFAAVDIALARALELVGPQRCGAECTVRRYLNRPAASEPKADDPADAAAANHDA